MLKLLSQKSTSVYAISALIALICVLSFLFIELRYLRPITVLMFLIWASYYDAKYALVDYRLLLAILFFAIVDLDNPSYLQSKENFLIAATLAGSLYMLEIFVFSLRELINKLNNRNDEVQLIGNADIQVAAALGAILGLNYGLFSVLFAYATAIFFFAVYKCVGYDTTDKPLVLIPFFTLAFCVLFLYQEFFKGLI